MCDGGLGNRGDGEKLGNCGYQRGLKGDASGRCLCQRELPVTRLTELRVDQYTAGQSLLRRFFGHSLGLFGEFHRVKFASVYARWKLGIHKLHGDISAEHRSPHDDRNVRLNVFGSWKVDWITANVDSIFRLINPNVVDAHSCWQL